MTNWNQFLSPGENQFSSITREDTLACASFSAIHIIESIEIKRFGATFEYSERALAKLSGTGYPYHEPNGYLGNSVENVVDAINKYGLILEKDWPTLQDFKTLDEFYAPIPPEVMRKAIKIKVELKTSNFDWNEAPLWSILDYKTIDHMVEQLNGSQFFDSYLQYVKTINTPILRQYQLIVKSMSNVYTVLKIKKDGTKELAFALPATSETAAIDKSLNTGYPIPTLENGTKVDWGQFKPDFTINE